MPNQNKPQPDTREKVIRIWVRTAEPMTRADTCDVVQQLLNIGQLQCDSGSPLESIHIVAVK